VTRLLTAAVLLPLVWLVIQRGPAWVFLAVAIGWIGGASWECYRLLEARGGRPFKTLGLLASVAVAWAFAGRPPAYGPEAALAVATTGAALAAMRNRDGAGQMVASVADTLFPVLFVGLGLGHAIGLRSIPGEDGKDLLTLLLVCVILSDAAAYYVGRSFGRRRLAPVLSPAKSWEGALGGIAASALGALLAHAWFYQRLPAGHALLVGLLLGIAGVGGDLAESMVKRAAGAKDSSSLLPGHGGLLDRADSLLFAGPALYYYYKLVLGPDS
jgi:phosphatidate cytidylyltransferase